MVESGFRIGKVFGIPIYLHASWFIIFFLITFSLATQFAGEHPDWSKRQHWALGLATSVLFFGSVLFHELAHSVVALRYKVPVVSITLFVFGGLARIGREPSTAKQEFNIAIAGPLSSYFLGGVFYLLASAFPQREMLGALATWLWQINVMLATFNLVPGFPLDGGRIFRAIVWGWTKDYRRASQLAAVSGQLIAYAMILFGVFSAFTGNFLGGLWIAFIGWFLLSAAQGSRAQLLVRDALDGVRAGDVMTREIPVVPNHISLEDYMQEMVRTGRRCHLVVNDGQWAGLINLHALNRVPRDQWAATSVQGAMLQQPDVQRASPDEPLLRVLERMQASDVNQMPVVEDGRVLGMVSRDLILRIIQTRLEISGGGSAPQP